MIRIPLFSSAAVLAVALPLAAHAQGQKPGYGGAKGADLSIEAMEPDNGDVTIGRAGEQAEFIEEKLGLGAKDD